MKAKANGKAKRKAKSHNANGKTKAEAKPQGADDGDGPMVGPPFSLHHRWRPLEKAQCYLCGTVVGEPKKIITNVSVQMSNHFFKIMESFYKEARAGVFTTKGDVVNRRGELLSVIAEQPDEPAEATEQADTTERAIPAATTVPEEALGVDID